MKVGVISDVHGNLPALQRVMEELNDHGVDAQVNAGDVVGYNPWPASCIESMMAVPMDPDATSGPEGMPTVMGNHDRAVIEGGEENFNEMAREAVEYTRDGLAEDHREWLSALPEELVGLGGRMKIVHGHPDDPDHYTFPAEFGPDLLGEEDVLVMGHTHVQHHEVYDEGIVLNPGSVGQPRDGDPRAAYAVVHMDEMRVEEHRVEYDVERVQEAVREAGLPEELGMRLEVGR